MDNFSIIDLLCTCGRSSKSLYIQISEQDSNPMGPVCLLLIFVPYKWGETLQMSATCVIKPAFEISTVIHILLPFSMLLLFIKGKVYRCSYTYSYTYSITGQNKLKQAPNPTETKREKKKVRLGLLSQFRSGSRLVNGFYCFEGKREEVSCSDKIMMVEKAIPMNSIQKLIGIEVGGILIAIYNIWRVNQHIPKIGG